MNCKCYSTLYRGKETHLGGLAQVEHSTMWGPPVIRWFIDPMNTIVITINHSEIGVMFTNLAIERGPHFVETSTNFYYGDCLIQAPCALGVSSTSSSW